MRSSIFTNPDSKSVNVFGLDLGTTNSVVTAKITEGLSKVLKSKSGDTTPSCVTFKEDGSYDIGAGAYAQRHLPETVYSFKKYMGTDRKLHKNFTPRNIASMFVKTLIEEVKSINPEFRDYFGIQVSVPAYFDINQVEDTKLAIEEAGFTVVGVNDEPTAAALLYQKAKRITETILVFDFGGGTFDAVLMKNIPGIPSDSREFYKTLDVNLPKTENVLEILDISGDNQLGGDDIDKVAAELYLKHYKMTVSETQLQQVILCAEKVKKYGIPSKPSFTNSVFLFDFVEQATKEVLARCMEITNAMLNRAKEFNVNCVLCGGSTKSEIIRSELAKHFTISTDIDPDLAVGIGNSIKYSMELEDSGMSIISRLAKGVGVLSGDKVKYLADKGSIIPLHSKFSARNAEPFGTMVNINLYQGDKFTGDHTHISTVTLDNIKGHDENGYVEIIIGLTITANGTISVEVSSGNAQVQSNLILNESKSNTSNETGVHKDAVLYAKFTKASDRYKDKKLYDLVDEYKETGSRDLAKSIMKYLGQLAN